MTVRRTRRGQATIPAIQRSRRFLSVAVIAAVCGCGDGVESFDPPMTVAVTPSATIVSFGALSDTLDETQILSRVRDAALSASGRYLAVADDSPPFLRILDRETGIARGAGPEGQGPGELMSAYAVDFLGDSVILVLSDQGLEHFTTSGEWQGGHRLGATGLQVSDVTVGCGGSIHVYGVPAHHRQLETVPWVHRLELTPEIAARTRLTIPGTGYDFGWGGLYGFDGTEEGILLWHKAKDPQVGYWLPCGDGDAELWSHTASEEEGVEAAFELDDGRGGMALTLPDTLFAGAAARGSVKIRARRPLESDERAVITTLHVVARRGCQEVGLVGRWSLRDAHAEGLVLSRLEPFPSVAVLDWEWFVARLSPVRCAP